MYSHVVIQDMCYFPPMDNKTRLRNEPYLLLQHGKFLYLSRPRDVRPRDVKPGDVRPGDVRSTQWKRSSQLEYLSTALYTNHLLTLG
jgi:hypothetical protein